MRALDGRARAGFFAGILQQCSQQQEAQPEGASDSAENLTPFYNVWTTEDCQILHYYILKGTYLASFGTQWMILF